MLIIKQTEEDLFQTDGVHVEYFVFNTDEEFEDHKSENESNKLSGGIRFNYNEISVSTLKIMPMNYFENTSLEQFIKIQKVLIANYPFKIDT